MAFATTAALALVLLPSDVEPWFARASCARVVERTFSGELESAVAMSEALVEATDPDERVCGLWVRPVLDELRLAIEGRDDELHALLARHLDALDAFAREHATEPRFADLAIEAKLRRIRLDVVTGERAAAVVASREVTKLLEARRRSRVLTPSYLFAEATANLAVSRADWAVRTVLKLAGVEGDVERGTRALSALVDKASVYQSEALYLSRSFSEGDEARRSEQIRFAEALARRYPKNPQLAVELAEAYVAADRFTDAAHVIEPFVALLDRAPSSWSPKLRAKLYWLSGRCALASGQRSDARRFAEAARAEGAASVEERIDALWSDLDS